MLGTLSAALARLQPLRSR